MMLSIVCPIYNEVRYIKGCIESIVAQDYPKDSLEVLFVDGMSLDGTRDVVQQFMSLYPFIKLLDNPKKITPTALNIGVTAAKGSIIFRLDAHAIYPNNYFSILVKYLEELRADNVGGICRTLPVNNTNVCVAIACALSSPFGMGNSYFRIGIKDVKKVDTVPFGCFRKEIFDKVGLFDEELIRNQDDEFNGRIIKEGGCIYLIPEVIIDYYARDSIKKVIKMFYQYGLFKPLVNIKLRKPTTIRQFFPVLFVIGLIVGGVLSIFTSLVYIYILVVSLYWCLAFYFALSNIRKIKRLGGVMLLPFIFFMIHVSYGWGYLVGIFKVIFKSSFSVVSNR